MKGDTKIIAHLNTALKNELTAINQYFLHSRMLEDWGVSKLAQHEYKESIEEMHHADTLLKRILFLEGAPDMTGPEKLKIGKDVKSILQNNLALELDGAAHYKNAIAYAESVKDYVSRDLFAKILGEEEGHIDYLETELTLIETMGIQNYIQLNSQSPLDGGH